MRAFYKVKKKRKSTVDWPWSFFLLSVHKDAASRGKTRTDAEFTTGLLFFVYFSSNLSFAYVWDLYAGYSSSLNHSSAQDEALHENVITRGYTQEIKVGVWGIFLGLFWISQFLCALNVSCTRWAETDVLFLFFCVISTRNTMTFVILSPCRTMIVS